MPLSQVAQALVRRGVITRESAVEAERRKKLYGGDIDTALLEIRATDEETLTTHLAEIIGIPLAPESVVGDPAPAAASNWMDVATAQRLGVVPRAMHDDVLDVLARPEHDHDAMVDWAQARSLLIEPELVCEARFRGLLHKTYDVPVPPRYLALLARLAGTAKTRAVVRDSALDQRTPPPLAGAIDRVATLLSAARLGDPPARRLALRRLTHHLLDSRVIAFRHALLHKAETAEPDIAVTALQSLAELRDKNAVPAIAEMLGRREESVSAAAHATLVALTCEDLGERPKRWLDWWARMGAKSRVEWLLEGLAHRTPEIRLLASTDLYEISHEYFGYHHDLPERDREEARQRWIAWWQSKGGNHPP
jgi:hypothetical protein